MALVTTVTQWLPHHTGLGIGLIMMGLGGSSFAFIPLQTAFINPHDKEPNHQSNTYPEFFYFTQEDILERVPTMFIILGTIYVVFQLISIPFIVEYRDVELQSKSISSILKYVWSVVKPRRPNIRRRQDVKAEAGLHKTMSFKENTLESGCSSDHHSTTVNTNELSLDRVKSETNVNPLELLKRWDFYLILFGALTAITCDEIFLASYKIIGHNVQYSDHVLAVIGSIASLFNCISRILLGHLADQIPCKVVLVLILGGLSSFSYTFLATPIVSIWMFGVWIFVIFLCIGGSFSVLPTCCRSWYGQKHFSTNYGIIRSGSSIGSVISIIMSTYGYSALGWEGLFLFTGSLCFLGMLAIVIGGDRTLKAKDEPNKGQ
jgi:MFS family permease